MTNYDKIKENFRQQQKRMEERERGWWTPQEDGNYLIRILPPWTGSDVWYKEYGVHYFDDPKTGDRVAITCPKATIAAHCTLCDFVRGLWNTKDEADKKLAGKLRSKSRACSNIIVVSSPSDVKIYPYGEKVLHQLRRQQVGSSTGAILPFEDAEKGNNVNLEKKSKRTGDGETFPDYLALVEAGSCPLKDKTVLQRLNNLDQIINGRVKTSEEIAAFCSGQMPASDFMAAKTLTEEGGKDEVETADDEPALPPPAAQSAPAAQPASSAPANPQLEDRLKDKLRTFLKK